MKGNHFRGVIMDTLDESRIVGRGRTAAVYDIGDGKVLKLFYEGFSRAACEQERLIAESLNDAGLDAPRCYGSREIGGRYGIVYDRVVGSSLLDVLSSTPLALRKITRSFTEVQYGIHRASAPGLPRQKDSLVSAIHAGGSVLGARLGPVLERLAALDDGESVCHGDFHPGNVLESGDSFQTIDWMCAVRGNPLGDAARTWLLLKSPFMPDDTPFFMRAISGILKGALLRIWLKDYLGLAGAKFSDVRPWILPYAAARIREGVSGERDWLLGLIDRELSRGA
jgi:hypothetical protein